jgi:nucleoside phosphorylase
MGQRNAERSVREALATHKPGLVLTCGFAGGLRPDLKLGAVLFSGNGNSSLETAMLAAGAQRGQFLCRNEVAATSEQKRTLWKTTGADAVEMESEFICAVCRERQIPCATIRVILDPADQDLPLDFNQLMNAEQQIDYWKLALAIMKSPGKIGALLRLQKQSQFAAEKLAEVLVRILPAAH